MNIINGIWRILPSSAISEIIAQSGYDFQILDCEHGVYDYFTLENDIRACQLNNCKSYIRVSGLNKVEVQRCLDIGADGIVFPQLNSYKDCKIAVEMLKFPPNGIRGFNPFVKALNYGYNSTKYDIKTTCIIIIENLNMIKDLDNILDLDFDMVYIGAYDLSAELNCIGEMENENLQKTINEIIEKCMIKKKQVAIMSTNYEYIKQYNYVNHIVHTVESFMIKKFFKQHLDNFKF
jgi:4-hydroxy-2-oxoheptanedioate aldolase